MHLIARIFRGYGKNLNTIPASYIIVKQKNIHHSPKFVNLLVSYTLHFITYHIPSVHPCIFHETKIKVFLYLDVPTRFCSFVNCILYCHVQPQQPPGPPQLDPMNPGQPQGMMQPPPPNQPQMNNQVRFQSAKHYK